MAKEGLYLKKSKRNEIPGIILPVIVIAAIAAVIAVVVFLFPKGGQSSVTKADVEQTVARLQAMENRDTAEIENQVTVTDTGTADDASSPAPADESSLDSIRQSILDGSGVMDNVTIRQKFKNTAIMGDSITNSIWEYEFLDQDVVISERGLSVINANDQVATTIAMNPRVIFMGFGSNDLESYESNVDGFIEGYKTQVRKLQEALPGVPIYINCVLPITEEAIASIPALQYYPQYNEALIQMCNEMGLTFVDNSFILENDSSLYEPDGEHPTSPFYPLWLSYMAYVAGL